MVNNFVPQIGDSFAVLNYASYAGTFESYAGLRIAPTMALQPSNAGNSLLLTVEYRKTTRPKNRVLVDYRQNAWGQTLASIYSVRPTATASVSTPLTWAEVEKGVAIEDFRLDNVRARIRKVGDLWKPLLAARDRFDLSTFFGSAT